MMKMRSDTTPLAAGPEPETADTDEHAGSVPERRSGGDLVHCGAELVELSERFFRGVLAGAAVFVSLASIAALVLLPTRASVPSTGPPITVGLAMLLVVTAPIAVWRAAPLYRLLRSRPRLELVPFGVAAALLVHPLRSELWWPACGLLMLLAAIVPPRRALAYCLLALLANFVAHVVAGDLTSAPPVSIIGLWIGLVFWTATFGLITDRLAAALMRVNVPRPLTPTETVRVAAWSAAGTSTPTGDDGEQDPRSAESEDEPPIGASTGRLTARQLQVVLLLADGLRYRDIAACLSISERQVQRHVRDAITRIGARTTGELVALVVEEGVLRAREGAVSTRSA